MVYANTYCLERSCKTIKDPDGINDIAIQIFKDGDIILRDIEDDESVFIGIKLWDEIVVYVTQIQKDFDKDKTNV